jgi:hypothetical protein
MSGHLLVPHCLNGSIFPCLSALRLASLRPMSDAIAADIVSALPSLTLLELQGSGSEVTSLSFVRAAGPLLVDLCVVFAKPFLLEESAVDALLPRTWRHLLLRVVRPDLWISAGVTARELHLIA